MILESPTLFFSKGDYLNILSSLSIEAAAGYLAGKFIATEVGRVFETRGISLRDIYKAIDHGYGNAIGKLISEMETRERLIAEKVLWVLLTPDLYYSLKALSAGLEPPLMVSPLPIQLLEALRTGDSTTIRKNMPRELTSVVTEYLEKKNVSLPGLVKAMDELVNGISKYEYYESRVVAGLLHDLLLIKLCYSNPEVKQLQPRAFSLNPGELLEICGKSIVDSAGLLAKTRPVTALFSSILSDALRFSSGVEALDLAIYTSSQYLASLLLLKPGPERAVRLVLKLLGQNVLLKLAFTVVHSGLYRQEAAQFMSKWVV